MCCCLPKAQLRGCSAHLSRNMTAWWPNALDGFPYNSVQYRDKQKFKWLFPWTEFLLQFGLILYVGSYLVGRSAVRSWSKWNVVTLITSVLEKKLLIDFHQPLTVNMKNQPCTACFRALNGIAIIMQNIKHSLQSVTPNPVQGVCLSWCPFWPSCPSFKQVMR